MRIAMATSPMRHACSGSTNTCAPMEVVERSSAGLIRGGKSTDGHAAHQHKCLICGIYWSWRRGWDSSQVAPSAEGARCAMPYKRTRTDND